MNPTKTTRGILYLIRTVALVLLGTFLMVGSFLLLLIGLGGNGIVEYILLSLFALGLMALLGSAL